MKKNKWPIEDMDSYETGLPLLFRYSGKSSIDHEQGAWPPHLIVVEAPPTVRNNREAACASNRRCERHTENDGLSWRQVSRSFHPPVLGGGAHYRADVIYLLP